MKTLVKYDKNLVDQERVIGLQKKFSSTFRLFAIWICLCFCLEAETKAKHFILTNDQVPLGLTLAKDYAKMHGLDPKESIISINMPIFESISAKEFKEMIKIPLLNEFKKRKVLSPHTLLTVYGVPLYVKDQKRIRSVDQLLTLPFWNKDLKGNVVGNPYYQKRGHQPGHPLFVCRLDAPTSSMAIQLLKRWRDHRLFGPFKRYLLDEDENYMKPLLEKHSLYVHDKRKINLLPLREITFETLSEPELFERRKQRKRKRYGQGTIIVQRHGSKLSNGDFRSDGDSGVSTAITLGASFFIGKTKNTLSPKEDLFDTYHFWERYLQGASFADSVYGAMTNLTGSMIIIGDPLAKPFASSSLKRYEEFYNQSQLPKDDKKFLHQHLFAKDWWLLRPALEQFSLQKDRMAVGILKGAQLIRQHTLIYSEVLIRHYTKLGKHKELNKAYTRLKKSKYTSPWYLSFIPSKP